MRGLRGTKIRKDVSLRKSDWLFGNPVSHGQLTMSATKVAREILHCKGGMSCRSKPLKNMVSPAGFEPATY